MSNIHNSESKSKTLPRPNASELAILKYLWGVEQASARELHEAVGTARDWSLSSTRTTISRMETKGLIGTNKVHGVTVFAARAQKVPTLASLMKDFLGRVMEHRGPLPTSAFADSGVLSAEDLAEIERLFEEDE